MWYLYSSKIEFTFVLMRLTVNSKLLIWFTCASIFLCFPKNTSESSSCKEFNIYESELSVPDRYITCFAMPSRFRQAHDLIKHAASNGVLEAADVMAKVCNMGKCDIWEKRLCVKAETLSDVDIFLFFWWYLYLYIFLLLCNYYYNIRYICWYCISSNLHIIICYVLNFFVYDFL